LAIRVQRLPLQARELAQAASVIGGDASLSQLARVAGMDHPSDAVDILLRREVMWEAGRSPDLLLRFRHRLLRDATLRTLTPERARALYGRAADWLKATMSEDVETIAFYLYRAAQWKEAYSTLATAARRRQWSSPFHAGDLWDLAARAAQHLGDDARATEAREAAARLRSPSYRGENWRPTPASD
jgi:predicted ATPase